jgi:hypothetical protein
MTAFLNVKSAPAVFVLYLGVVSHWVSVVVHRDGANFQIYLMDSSNIVHLDKPVSTVSQIVHSIEE